uniref:Rab5-interacting protein n=1 Tax=Panagrolaimus sp. PS1159 TaxID=55785 RepID=A0AC35FCF3_9BILA
MAEKDKKIPTISDSFSKAIARKSIWYDKDELLDVLYWGRQILGLLLGFIFGVVPIRGILGLVSYVGISTYVGQMFVTQYQEQDEEEYGGFWELAKEGFGAAFATFMISWITVYSFAQY